MRYGIELPNAGAWGDARTCAELAALAEVAGWDGVFLEDYIVWQNDQAMPTYDPWVTLAAMAMRTERVSLGTEVTPLARRRPWKVAKEAATLDHLSNGRMILGVGLGDAGASFESFGEVADGKQRAAILDEALAVLAGLWSGEPFGFQGDHFTVSEVMLLPTPVQRPRIPIWIGGAWPKAGPTRRAARWDGSCLYKHTEDGGWKDMQPEDVRALRAEVTRLRGYEAPFDIALGGNGRSDDWEREREHIARVAEAGATWWIEYLSPEIGDRAAARAAIERGPLRAQ
jgi:alkanesulfonate monooxygenase SsuD/methylene tetrahydromethanopterin reductase-like flavin-dependent oxidoreductase (luciferase family)